MRTCPVANRSWLLPKTLKFLYIKFTGTELDRLIQSIMAVKRGEIYFVDLNPAKGKEQTGTRLVLVLFVDAINNLHLVCIEATPLSFLTQ